LSFAINPLLEQSMTRLSMLATSRKALPFGLEHPAGIIEGRIGQRGQHGLPVLGKLRLSWHGFSAWQNPLAKLALKVRAACSFGAPRAGACPPTP
jgi:hypothetical protein